MLEKLAELINEFLYDYDEAEYENNGMDYNEVKEQLELNPESVAEYLEEIDNEEYVESALRLAKKVRLNLC